jgi:DNA repair exonuclease SbcCD ATPase subunit
MKIVKLTAENFMKLVAVEIKPDGNTVLITGKNGAGKSCVLDAITAALCGKKAMPQKPIRGDEDHAEIRIETENYVIKRTFTKDGGGVLSITNAEGMKAQSPQALLDKIVGEIAFDPTKFIRLCEDESGRREQREILMKLTGLDFSDIDKELEEIKEQRSKAKYDKESAEKRAEAIVEPECAVPSQPVNIEELNKKLKLANDHNNIISQIQIAVNEAQNKTTSAEADFKRIKERIISIESAMKAYVKEVETERKRLEEAEYTVKKCKKYKEELVKKIEPLIDICVIQTEINLAHETNKRIEQKAQKAKLFAEVEAARGNFAALGKKMQEVESQKAKRLAESKMPVKGLGVDDNGVIFEGIPFSQTNTAKQLEIAVAISMALNPKLRVIRMNGNDLDSESLKIIQKIVKEKDYQVWIEKVSEDETVGIFIEDGNVKQT